MLVCERLAVARGEFAAVSPRGRRTKTHLLKERIKRVCGRKTEVEGGRHLTYLTASTSVHLGGGVWVGFIRPCTHKSSVYNCRYGLKLKRSSLGWGWSCMR